MSQSKLIKELLTPVKRNRKHEHQISAPVPGWLQIDLMQMTKEASRNKNYNYGLNIIDIYSRYATCIPLKNKTALETAHAFEKWLSEHKNVHVENITSDDGSEWKGAFKTLLEQRGIIHHIVEVGDHHSLGLIDRFTGTLRRKILEEWLKNGDLDWISHIKQIIDTYNNTKHRTIDAKPIDVWNGIIEPKQELREIDRLIEGDNVRVKVKKDLFDKKSSTQNYSTEVYEIKQKDGNRYILDGLPGRFARYDLLKSVFQPERDKPRQIIQPSVRKQQTEVKKDNSVMKKLKQVEALPSNIRQGLRERKEKKKEIDFVYFGPTGRR